MAAVTLEWGQFGNFDSFTIYRSNSGFTSTTLPPALATGISKMYYADFSVAPNTVYYYMVAGTLGGITKYSALSSVSTANVTNDVKLVGCGAQAHGYGYSGFSVPYPTGIIQADLLLFFLVANEPSTVSVPSGFTLANCSDWGSSAFRQKVFWRRANGTETGSMWYYVATDDSNPVSAQIVCYRSGNPGYLAGISKIKALGISPDYWVTNNWVDTPLMTTPTNGSLTVLSASRSSTLAGYEVENKKYTLMEDYSVLQNRIFIAHKFPADTVNTRFRWPNSQASYEYYKAVAITLSLVAKP